jgi:hypothetical protein
MNESEKSIINNIEKYGCHINSVFDNKGEDPDFSYTVGIQKSQNQPELIIFGLRKELGAWIANEYNRKVIEGIKFDATNFYSGFIDGFDVCFKPVSKRCKEEYMLSCCWLYGDQDFEAVQLIYPTVKGIWPWETEASASFKSFQPSMQEPISW